MLGLDDTPRLDDPSSSRTRSRHLLVLSSAAGVGAGFGLLKHLETGGVYSSGFSGGFYVKWIWAVIFATVGGLLGGICCMTLQASCKISVMLSKRARTLYSTLEVTVVAAMCQFFQCLIHNQFCNVLFRCGCTWDWNGGWVRCNVHNMNGPKCPWCVSREYLSWTTDCLPLALMFTTFFASNARGHNASLSAFLSAAVFLIVLFVVGLTYKIVSGYPYFLFGKVHGTAAFQWHTSADQSS